MFPAEPELMGLLSLMLLQHSRQLARFDGSGAPILLEDQERERWSQTAIAEGLAMLDKAMLHRRPGPYQLQAAIAALHARAKRAADTDWGEISQLYEILEQHTPSPVVTLNRAVAVFKLRGAHAALDIIEPLADALSGYFYFHGMHGMLLKEMKRHAEAREAWNRAIALANTPAEALHIRQLLDRL
jgi:RNA polymerase sigma-70 factor (ECF subfamily)